MLWFILALMALIALAAVVWPLYRTDQRIGLRAAAAGVSILLVSGVLYQQIGSPGAINVTSGPPDVEAMVTSLAERLEREPDDIEGWKMLGRSYSVMRDYAQAIKAYERAVELENSSNGQTVVDLGEAVFFNDGRSISGRAGELFESALAITPGNPKALFYSGLGAAERGDVSRAADRWEALLATSPPPEIESVLKTRISEWRGEPAAAVAAAELVELAINVSLGEEARAAVPGDATVFVIARDPKQPSPPIAVARRKADELPIDLTLTDADAMIPGRNLSSVKDLEIVSRASVSGQPMAQTGDWFGQQQLDTSETRELTIVIDQRVP